MGGKVSVSKEYYIHEQLIYYCKYGQLDQLNYLYLEYPNIDLSRNEEEAFRVACDVGEVHIIRQLKEWNPGLNISAKNYMGLCRAISYGHVDVIKQILSWDFTINPMDFLVYAFQDNILDLLNDLSKRRLKIAWIHTSLSNEYNLECPVCQDIPNEYILTPCNHNFCQKCILKWYEINQSCPYCREIF